MRIWPATPRYSRRGAGRSLSRLVAGQLETLVRGEQTYAAARRRALARLRRGYDMGGERPLTRDEVHDRESLR